jgi:hypothetical protein
MPVAAQERSAAAGLSVLDHFEIRQLFARFAHGLDSAANEGRLFASAFTADGEYIDEAGTSHRGVEALSAFARRDPDAVKGPSNVRHFTTSVLVEQRPEGVTGRSQIMIVTGPAGGTRMVTVAGEFLDHLVMTADGWRIARRTFARPGAAAPPLPQGARAVQTARRAPPPFTADDYAAIEHLYARYTYAWDGVLDDGQAWVELFTPDGSHTNETTRPKQFFFGHHELRGFARAMKLRGNRVPATVGHFITNIMIEPMPDGAAVKAYRLGVRIPALGSAGGLGPSGIYFDYLVESPDGWRYRRKNFIAANAAVPDTAVTPDPPAR